jgi:hypothetical protein
MDWQRCAARMGPAVCKLQVWCLMACSQPVFCCRWDLNMVHSVLLSKLQAAVALPMPSTAPTPTSPVGITCRLRDSQAAAIDALWPEIQSQLATSMCFCKAWAARYA